MAPPRRMTRDRRRASLLEIAADVVAASGASALSFDALATAAGVTKSLPYAYFESPEEILLALFDDVVGTADAEVAAIVRAGGAFEDVIAAALAVWFDAARDRGRLVGALLDGRSVPGLQQAVARRDRASLKLWHDVAVERFGLGDTDALVLASMLNSTATAVVGLWVRRKASRAALVESFVAMATGAARARSGAGRG